MRTLHDADEAREFVYQLRREQNTVGLVPTMGALHEGHLSLVRSSVQRCDATIATIFVNPTQFAPDEDLEKYPRTLQRDCELLDSVGANAVFLPSVDAMYPDGFSTFVQPPEVSRTLEGVCRPGHFRGVTTVVMKLFQMLPTTHAFFGRKDYQQLKVIQAMTRDLNVGIEIVAGETVRESDGLALSSRNRYLSDSDRKRALSLSAALNRVSQLASKGETDVEMLQLEMRKCLLGDSANADDDSVNATLAGGVDKIDYAVIVDAESLVQIDKLSTPAVALIAAHVGQTRLIDNASITIGSGSTL
ncbi:MAG: pantoate--beta-alanine ligase [Pirellulaceae bacterium]|nr:pantoate--beta-alanine ligase [Pirellulaceae bacterium]